MSPRFFAAVSCCWKAASFVLVSTSSCCMWRRDPEAFSVEPDKRSSSSIPTLSGSTRYRLAPLDEGLQHRAQSDVGLREILGGGLSVGGELITGGDAPGPLGQPFGVGRGVELKTRTPFPSSTASSSEMRPARAERQLITRAELVNAG